MPSSLLFCYVFLFVFLSRYSGYSGTLQNVIMHVHVVLVDAKSSRTKLGLFKLCCFFGLQMRVFSTRWHARVQGTLEGYVGDIWRKEDVWRMFRGNVREMCRTLTGD